METGGFCLKVYVWDGEEDAPIQKETITVMWACEKIAEYILGQRFLIEQDHKPHIPLLKMKQLDKLRLPGYDFLWTMYLAYISKLQTPNPEHQ